MKGKKEITDIYNEYLKKGFLAEAICPGYFVSLFFAMRDCLFFSCAGMGSKPRSNGVDDAPYQDRN